MAVTVTQVRSHTIRPYISAAVPQLSFLHIPIDIKYEDITLSLSNLMSLMRCFPASPQTQQGIFSWGFPKRRSYKSYDLLERRHSGCRTALWHIYCFLGTGSALQRHVILIFLGDGMPQLGFQYFARLPQLGDVHVAASSSIILLARSSRCAQQ